MTEQAELSRGLGVFEATAIGLGTMIGGGIFILPSIAAAQAGPASMLSFAMGGFVALLAALSISELATDMPTAGGSFYYVDRALGDLVGSVVGLGMWAGLLFATAFYAIGFAQYLSFFYAGLPVVGTATALTLVLVGINYYGASEAGAVQDVIVYSIVALILAFIAMNLPGVEAAALRPFNPEGWSAVVATTGRVFVSFIGFQGIATVGGEVERPARNLPQSMVISVVVPTVLYVLVMVSAPAYSPSTPWHDRTSRWRTSHGRPWALSAPWPWCSAPCWPQSRARTRRSSRPAG